MRKKALGSIVVVAVLALSGCSSSGTASSGGSVAVAAASKSDFCKLILAFKKANETLGNDLAATNAEQTKSAMKLLLGQLQTLLERAPSDLKADIDTANKFMVQLDSLMAQRDYKMASVTSDPKLEADLKNLSTAEVTGALDRIAAYTTTECALQSAPTPTS